MVFFPPAHIASSIPWVSFHIPPEVFSDREKAYSHSKLHMQADLCFDGLLKPMQHGCPAAWKATGAIPRVVLAHPHQVPDGTDLPKSKSNICRVRTGHSALCLQRRRPLQSDPHYVAIWQSLPWHMGWELGWLSPHLVSKLLKGKRAFLWTR